MKKIKTNYEIFKSIRKPIAPPTKVFSDKEKEFDLGKEMLDYE